MPAYVPQNGCVHIRRRKPFLRLVELVRLIEASPDDLEAVRACNRLILAEIVHAERAVRRHRARHRELRRALKTGRNDRSTSTVLRTKIKRAGCCIAAQEDRIFTWKCFGDALAFLYLDKFSIKHAFFEVDRLGIKIGAGLIDGKAGLDAELACLDAAISAGVPAVLCDITNVIRYGDVCLLGASDPMLLEVKSGDRLSQRGRRQMQMLDQLHAFLRTDRAECFRGLDGPVRRVAFKAPERTNIEALNTCIATAEKDGQATARPEPGVTIVAIYGTVDVRAIFDSLTDEPRMVFMLNGDKNDRAWSPYLPFVLSIRAGRHLLDFIEGRLFLIVLIDPRPLCAAMAQDGWCVRFKPEGEHAIQCFHPPTRAYLGLSREFLSRAAYDFVSLAWIAEVHRPSVDMVRQFASAGGDLGARIDDGEAERLQEQRLRSLLGDDPWFLDFETA